MITTTQTMAISASKTDEDGMSATSAHQGENGETGSVSGPANRSLSNGSAPKKDKGEMAIAKKETQAVSYARLVLLFALVCSALLVSVSAFMYLKNDEQQEFEEKFKSDARKVFEGIGSSLDNTLGAMDSYGAVMVAYTRLQNTTFPFITVPGFGIQAGKLLKLSKAYKFDLITFVSPENKAKWEQYMAENSGWV